MKNLKKYATAQNLFLAITLFLIFVLNIRILSDYDTPYHLETGKYIFENHIIPTRDIFSFSAQNALWINHYWLSDLWFYAVYHFLGPVGLVLSVALLAALTYFLILKTIRLKTRSFIPYFLVLALGYLTFEQWVARPQVFDYFFTALLVFLLFRFRVYGKRKALFSLPFIFLIWANIHVGVIAGLGILFLWLAATFIETRANFQALKLPLGISLASVIAAFLTPNGYLEIFYFRYVHTSSVLEFHSLLSFLQITAAKIVLAIIVLSVGFILWRFLKKIAGERDWFAFALGFTAGILPLIAIRNHAFLPILLAPILAWELAGYFKEKNLHLEIVKFAIIAIFVIFFIGAALHFPNLRGNLFNVHVLPVGASEFIAKEKIADPIFENFEFGGYFIWRFWPERKVFVDGRNEVYVSRGVNEDYNKIMNGEGASYGQPSWQDVIFSKYDFNAFLLDYRLKSLLSSNRRLASDLIKQLGFKLVYWDDASIILLADKPQNADIITNNAYNIINPFKDPVAIAPEDLTLAIEEIGRALAISPDSSVLRSYAYKLAEAVKSNKK